MTTVRTAHGDGEIIDSNTVRGRTTYKVAGDGFSVWLDETEVNKRTASDEHEASSSFDFEPTDHVWDNHTTLPYNWQPQFPVDMFRAEQTISPDHQIDLKERMHDSDSRTGEDREPTHTYPGPNPDLFAKQGSFLGHTPDHKIPEYLEHLRGKVQNQNISYGELSDLQGLASAGYIHPDDMELHEAAGTPEEDFNRGQDRDPDRDPFDPREFGANKQAWTFHDQDEESEPDRWEHLNEHAHGIEHAAASYEDVDPGYGDRVDSVKALADHLRGTGRDLDNIDSGELWHVINNEMPPEHHGELSNWLSNFAGEHNPQPEPMIPPEHRAPEGEPSWQDHIQAEGEHQDHLNFGPHQPEHPDHLGSHRPAGLSSKYADIHESVDHFNDPIQRFRDDPQTAIQRHAYIDISAGLDHETGEWMDLVQADKQIRTAAWNDVRKKAMRLKREGAVHVKDMSQDHIYANVDGDNGNYEVMILKGSSYGGMKGKPTGQSIADWKCSCDWGKWAFKRKLTYVGRLCSHGYASYLTMQGEYAKEPKHPFRKRNGSVDDFKKWVKDENGDHIDTDAADSYLSTLETPATKEEAEKVYDYVEDHHSERPERDYDQDGYSNDPDDAYKTADVLNHQPGKLTPHLYVVPEGKEQHFEDLGDDRKTTGPDQIMARVAKGEDTISEHHPDFAWHNKGEEDFPEQGIVHFSSLIYTADEDLINKLRDLSDDQPSEHFHDMQDHNREVSEVVEELHDRGYAAAPLVAMKQAALWKTADKNEDERQPIIPSSPGNWMHQFENSPVGGMLGINDPSGGATDYKGSPLNMPGDATSAPAVPETTLGVPKSVAGPGPGGSEGHTPDLPGGPAPHPTNAVFPAGAHPTDQFSSSGISGGGYKEPNAGKPGYSQSGQSSMYDPNGYNTPVAGAGAANAGGGAGKNNFWTGQPNAAAPAAVASPAKAAPAPVAAPLGGAPRNNTAGPAPAAPASSPSGTPSPADMAIRGGAMPSHPGVPTPTLAPGNIPGKQGSAQRFAERYFLADNDVHTDSGSDVHTDDKNKPAVGSSGLPPVTPSPGGPPPNGAVGKGGEDHYKVISPGGAQVNAPRPQAGLPTAPGPGVVTTPGGQGGQQAPGLAGAVGGPAGGGVGNVMSQLGPILNQIPGIGGALGGVMGMIPKGGSAQHFAAQYMHGAGSPTPMSNPAPAGKGKPSANQAAPATPSAPTAKPTAASAITGQIPNLLSGSGGGMGLASPTVGGMSRGLGGITKTLSAQHFARQYMAGGDFLTKGGPNWMDYPFCVDEKTEIFTDKGWKKYQDVLVGDSVLTLNHKTGLSEWQPVKKVNVFDGPHEMLSIESRTHSSLTTLNHRWAVLRELDRGRGYAREWRTSATLNGHDYIPTAAYCADLPEQQKYTDALVEAVAWFWTEGHILPDQKRGGLLRNANITQSYRVNPGKCDQIVATLTNLFGAEITAFVRRGSSTTPHAPTWRRSRDGDKEVFHLNAEAGELLQQFAPNRVPSLRFLSELTKSQLDLFIAISLAADGHERRAEKVLGQKDLEAAEAFQFACILAGHPTSISTGLVMDKYGYGMTSVAIKQSRSVKAIKGCHELIDHQGVVWCPTTENYTWLARRKGKVYFTGNSGSGPDRQDFSGTSEDYVEEHERPNRQETWRTDNEGDIIKYTQTQPRQAALFAARYFYADGDIAGSGDAGYGAGGATHPGGGDTYGGGIVHAPSSGSGSQDFATVGTQGGSTPTMGTMTNTAAWGGGRGRDRFIEMHGYSPECKNGGDWCSGCAQHPPMHQDAAMANWSELPERERPKEAALSESSRQFWADAFHPGQSGYFNPTNRPFQNDDSAQPKKVPPGKGKPKTPGAPAPAGGPPASPMAPPVPPGGALAEAAEAVPALASVVASCGGDDSDVVRRFHAAGAGALGSPTGASNGAYSDDAIATNARKMLRTAGRHFTRAEERELEDEQHVLGARNLKDLDLTGTHYLDD